MKILTMKNKIMFGVYLMYAMRKLKGPFVAETFTFAILAIILSVFVSVPSILSNMLSSPNFYRYFLIAFSNTTLMVQLILVASIIIATKAVFTFSRSSSVGRAAVS